MTRYDLERYITYIEVALACRIVDPSIEDRDEDMKRFEQIAELARKGFENETSND